MSGEYQLGEYTGSPYKIYCKNRCAGDLFGLPQDIRPQLQDGFCVDVGYKTSVASEDGWPVLGAQPDVLFVFSDFAHRTQLSSAINLTRC